MAWSVHAGELGTRGTERSGAAVIGPVSALYRGTVTHSRLEPFHHRFRYRVFYGLFDIDELGTLDEKLALFSVGRFNLFGFDAGDHGNADGTALRPWVERVLARADVDLEGGRVLLLAFPRVLGYVFDPISVWYCYGPQGDLRAVLHEVRNTFGDRHTYVAPLAAVGLTHEVDKQLHVSPFNDLNQRYRMTVTEPGDRLTVSIDQRDSDDAVFRAGMQLSRMELSDRNLLRLFVSHPLLTLKVVGGIHWQALRLWLKGARYHRRPEPVAHEVTVAEPSSFAR